MNLNFRGLVERKGSLLLFMLLLFSYQNCGQGFKAAGSQSLLSDGGVFQDNISKNTLAPNLLPDCLQRDDYNSCIFWKNPVAQKGAPLSQAIRSKSDLSDLQQHAVNITGYDNSGFLQNSFIKIRAVTNNGQSVSVSTKEKQFKFFYDDPEHRLGQVMAFYWLNVQSQYMKQSTGAFYALGKNIDVITYNPQTVSNAYWNPVSEQIVMGATPQGNEFALSAEVYAHEMGHANISFATGFKIHEVLGTDKNITCGGGAGVCCSTVNGCSWAINEGQADYHSGILFPQNTAFLESFSNSVNGISECGVPRSMTLVSGLSAKQAYDACSGDEGEVHVTGRIYASVWWEVRGKSEKLYPGSGSSQVDKLFTEHLPALNGDDDFISAIDKIVATDNALFGGKYGQLFVEEFARRGIMQ